MRRRSFRACACAATLLATGFVGTAAASPPVPPSAASGAPSSASIQSAKAHAAELEKEIARESEAQQIAGEQFDQAGVKLDQAQARLASIRRAIAREALAIHVEKKKVQTTAIDAYVYGQSASSQFGAVLTGNLNDAGTITTYAGVATNALHANVERLDAAQLVLDKSESNQQRAVLAASTAVNQQSSTKASLAAATNATSATLSQVKGQLAQLIAQQEAAEAAAAEAAAQAASAAQRQQAATAAAAAASVAAAVAASDPSPAAAEAATAAATAASAASAVGQPAVAPTGTSQAGNTAVAAAKSFLGVPYVWGGASHSGVDCSGLTMLAWAQAGVNLLHSAYDQYTAISSVALSQLEPGDLIFYYFPNDGTIDPVSHVVMYIGSGPYGTSTVIQAPETGQNVSYASLSYLGLVGAGRP